ncbi:mechanosensitive ion channel family protein [Pseudofulvibacter geojedonensis]|uniref:Mechanosensitive ion channel family protein n=1 Tax=Pseudofulvibacter geojedonensis TaxID=1123758 RepID=A0ABW3HZI2_9FLAO
MQNLAHLFFDLFVSKGMEPKMASYLNAVVLSILLMLIVLTVDYLARKVLITTFGKFALKSKTHFDDIVVANKVPRNIAHIFPLLIAMEFCRTIFFDFPYMGNMVFKGLQVFGVVLTLWIVRSILTTTKDYFKTLPRLKDKPIDSYIQVFMIFAWGLGLVSILALITGISFFKFITTIGAGSAIIILIFRDTILGFVASIQVSINDMVRIGDWITFDKYGADGDVVEINLSTVKVQNFDKTITTIPTYALISDSFKNWRGMSNSEGRRIKRALNIKLNSVKYITKEEIVKYSDIELISKYIKSQSAKIEDYNISNDIDKSLLLNGRNLTNLGVFRKYVEEYLNNHSAINKDMMIMARQLAPTSQGMPIEIYAFSTDKRWANYEYIMADIFDHLIAALPYFDLELFELPNNGSFKVS